MTVADERGDPVVEAHLAKVDVVAGALAAGEHEVAVEHGIRLDETDEVVPGASPLQTIGALPPAHHDEDAAEQDDHERDAGDEHREHAILAIQVGGEGVGFLLLGHMATVRTGSEGCRGPVLGWTASRSLDGGQTVEDTGTG